MELGSASAEPAENPEEIWQEQTTHYLPFSADSHNIQEENSTHYIHPTQPELIPGALNVLAWRKEFMYAGIILYQLEFSVLTDK